MEDLASLGFHVDSSGIKGATRELRKMDSAQERAERSNKQLATASNALKAALAGVVASLGVREIIRYADGWQNVANQLRQVTDGTRELEMIQGRLVAVAKDTRSNFDATANLYARLARSTTEMNLSQEELIRLTTTINQSFAVSGATATEAAASITQLSQGLAAGALRGEEFNSVAEQAPALMRAIADSLGMTIGELRAFAQEGGVTAEIVVNALQEASEEIDQSFSKTIATFSQNIEVARTNVMQWIGTNSAISDSVGVAGAAIVALSDNIDELVTVAGAGLLVFLARTAGGLQVSAAEAVKKQAAMVSLASQTAKATGAEAAYLRAIQGSLSAELASTTSTTRKIALRQQLAANTTALTVAQARYTKALASSTVVARAATGAMATLNGAMAFLGGPLGVALIAAGSLYYFRDALFSGRQEASEAVKEIQGLADGYRDLTKAQVENERYEISAQMRKNKVAIAEAREELERLQQKQSERSTGNTLVPGGMSGVVDITKAQSAIAELIRQNEALEQSMESLNNRGEELASQSGERDERRAQTAAEAVDKIISGLQDEYLQLTLNEEQLLRHKLAVQGASEAEVQLAINTLRTSRAIEEQRKQRDALSEMRRDLDPAFAEFDRYADQVEQIEAFNITMAEKEQLREAAFWEHQERMADIARQGSEQIAEQSNQWSDKIEQNQKQISSQTMQALGNTMGAIKGFTEEGTAEWAAMVVAQRGIMAAQAFMAANLAATLAMASPMAGVAPAAVIAQAETMRSLGYVNAGLILAQGIGELAGARADGGSVSGGNSYLVGERGPEILTMGGSGYVTPNHKISAGGGSGVTVNLIEDSSRAGKTEVRKGSNGQEEVDVFVSDIMGGGPRSKAMQTAFGLKRQGR